MDLISSFVTISILRLTDLNCDYQEKHIVLYLEDSQRNRQVLALWDHSVEVFSKRILPLTVWKTLHNSITHFNIPTNNKLLSVFCIFYAFSTVPLYAKTMLLVSLSRPTFWCWVYLLSSALEILRLRLGYDYDYTGLQINTFNFFLHLFRCSYCFLICWVQKCRSFSFSK